MSVKFNVSARKDPRNQESEPKYYATIKSTGRVDTYGVAKSINNMSTVSSVDTTAVLEAFMNVVPDHLADGKIVELGDFGTFRISVSSEGAAQASEVTSRNITDVRVIFAPGKRFKKLLTAAEFEKFADN
jgi:predicted histone-like DNA-binding protein